eukprot:7490808-Pyramimonas_sp.AAC.1
MSIETAPPEDTAATDAEIQELTDKIASNPKRVDYVFGRANVYRNKGHYHKVSRFPKSSGLMRGAIEDFTKVLELEPGHRSALVMRGEANRKVGNEEQAIADYTRALFIDPADLDAYLVRGQSNILQGHYEDAVFDYTKALDLVPRCVPALMGRAEALRLLGRYDEAFNDVRVALAIEPQNIAVMALQAKIFMSAGNVSFQSTA